MSIPIPMPMPMPMPIPMSMPPSESESLLMMSLSSSLESSLSGSPAYLRCALSKAAAIKSGTPPPLMEGGTNGCPWREVRGMEGGGGRRRGRWRGRRRLTRRRLGSGPSSFSLVSWPPAVVEVGAGGAAGSRLRLRESAMAWSLSGPREETWERTADWTLWVLWRVLERMERVTGGNWSSMD